ncbi:MAG: DUF1805 domain-containing protein [Candidatus Omnitrophica bacterium]|nr:DUF1805 domain-containing protein [Candidatus Omnitrophota bacterium]
MIVTKKIKVGKKTVYAFCIKLCDKSLIVLKASGGYIMCGYLNMKTATKFKEVAVKITGISTIEQAVKAKAFAVSPEAKKLGIYKGQAIKEVLKIIA